MQTVTENFRKQVYSGEALYHTNLQINEQEVPIEQISSIEIDSPIIDETSESFYLGTFISQSIKINFKNLDGLDIASNNEVYLEIGEERESYNLFDGSSVSGRWNYTVGQEISPNTLGGYRNENPIIIEPSTTYTMTGTTNVNGGYIVETDEDNIVLSIDSGHGYKPIGNTADVPFTFTFTSHSQAKYLYWYIPNASAEEPTNLMVQEGDTATEYEQYGTVTEYIPIGRYLIDDLAEDYFTTCEINCLDYAIKLKPNIDYSPCFSVQNEGDEPTATVQTIFNYICEYFGIEVATDISTLPNINVTVGTYDSQISGKQWISYLAEIMGCNAKINRDGKLILIPLKHEKAVTINALESAEFTLGEKYEISRVVYFDAIRNFTYGEDINNTLFIRQDNPFITDESVVENIYNEVEGFKIWSLETKNYGDISLDAWDIIEYTLGEDEYHNPITYQTYNNNHINYEMNIASEVNTQIPTKQREITTNIYDNDEEVRVKMIKTLLDYVNAEVILQAQEQIAQSERLTQLKLSIDNIQNIFQITGGSNLITNSQFLFDDPEDDVTHERTYWNFTDNGSNPYQNIGNGFDGSLAGQTTSVAKIQLRDIIAETSNANIIGLKEGQTYTLNYSYKQDELTTTNFQLFDSNGNIVTYRKLNEETGIYEEKQINFTYDSEETNYKNETIQFIAPTSLLVLKITTATTSGDTNSGYFYLYDLMLNSGDKKTWEPAKSEVYSTVLKMSQLGLQVIATGSNIATLINADGFRIYTLNGENLGEEITSFNDRGLITGVAETSEVHTGNYVMTEIKMNNKEHHIEYFKESD